MKKLNKLVTAKKNLEIVVGALREVHVEQPSSTVQRRGRLETSTGCLSAPGATLKRFFHKSFLVCFAPSVYM